MGIFFLISHKFSHFGIFSFIMLYSKITAEKQRLLFKPVYSISVRVLGNDETILY